MRFGAPATPAAHAVDVLLPRVRYKPGWRFRVEGTSLQVYVPTIDSETGKPGRIVHGIPIPDVIGERPRSWALTDESAERTVRRWLFAQVEAIERHEAMEFFLVDGAAPFFPEHGPGARTYEVVEREEPIPITRPEATYFLARVPDDAPPYLHLVNAEAPGGCVDLLDGVLLR